MNIQQIKDILGVSLFQFKKQENLDGTPSCWWKAFMPSCNIEVICHDDLIRDLPKMSNLSFKERGTKIISLNEEQILIKTVVLFQYEEGEILVF